MKIINIVLFLFLSALCHAQVLDTIIDNRFSESFKKAPLRLKKGDKVEINTDSEVYLMNQLRYDYCKSLSNGDCEDHYEALLKSFKESIAQRDKMMKTLQTINEDTQEQTKKLIQIYEKELEATHQTLTSTQQHMKYAHENLQNALKNINEVRQENFWKKFWVGAGCTGAGIIIGLLLTR